MSNSSSPSSDAPADTSGKRSYRSPLRSQQAAQTRERIVDAARDCFSEHGYGGTTIAMIGRRAGVSTESVAANGPKSALMIAAFEQASSGREGADPLSERADLIAMFAIEDRDEMLAAFADFTLEFQRGGIGIWKALCTAAVEDGSVAELYRQLAERRLADHRLAIGAMDARGLLRAGIDHDELAASLALLNGFDPYQLFVLDFGWPESRLREWYIASIERMILAPRPAR
jgi:AcrR family transcriptional regulator